MPGNAPSHREAFFLLGRFAVVGNTELCPFPRLTCRGLRQLGKVVYPVELSGARYVDGDEAFPSLLDLPGPVDGVIIELPRRAVLPVVRQAEEAGVKDLWLHAGCDSPEVLEYCTRQAMRVRYGASTVMYTQQGFSLRRWLARLLGRY